jgi:drug/metabolite transporter (DMT)-like permease
LSDETLAVFLAVGAAMSWGFSAVLVRQGLRYLSTAAGTFLSLLSGLALTLVLALVLELDAVLSLSLSAILLFAVVGILNFPLGRFFNYLSINNLGVGRSTPILASAPLFAMVLAVIFADEKVSAGTFAGTALILIGLFITVRAPAAARRRNADD